MLSYLTCIGELEGALGELLLHSEVELLDVGRAVVRVDAGKREVSHVGGVEIEGGLDRRYGQALRQRCGIEDGLIVERVRSITKRYLGAAVDGDEGEAKASTEYRLRGSSVGKANSWCKIRVVGLDARGSSRIYSCDQQSTCVGIEVGEAVMRLGVGRKQIIAKAEVQSESWSNAPVILKVAARLPDTKGW